MSDDEVQEREFSPLRDDGGDSDRELQEAFKQGWLKPGLNYSAPASKKFINNISGLRGKLAEFQRSNLDWVERFDVTVPFSISDKDEQVPETSSASKLATLDEGEDDFKRELAFYKQAQLAVKAAVPKLHGLGIPTTRPVDYYAEMAKSDKHMTKVRAKLVNMQQAKERYQTVRRMREERKFATKVQKQVLQSRVQEKRKLNEAVKKHQKGVKGQLEDILENRRTTASETAPLNNKKQGKKVATAKRSYKDEKFGFGGRKKGKKSNTKDSFENVSGFSAKKHSQAPKGGQSKKKQRPGKNRRKSGGKKR